MMPEERTTNERECNQGRELVCIQLLLNMAREFYACEQNRVGFQQWMTGRAERKEESA